MTIERSATTPFHERGTLLAVTRWISSHNDGLAELFKNVRRQYQVDRANVAEPHRAAVLLLRDERNGKPARIGVLDVGGATVEDVAAWSTWQDTTASGRGSGLAEEETQGNGGKAYMYRLFEGQTRILGVRDGRRNCKGLEGEIDTVERGRPGWIPSEAAGRGVEISSFESELREVLGAFDVFFEELPQQMRTALETRRAFTLVDGVAPVGFYKNRIDAEDVIEKVGRHEQSLLCLEQVNFYVIHNGRLINGGRRLALPQITPYPGIESPQVFEIPETLPNDSDQQVSTTDNGTKSRGRLILHTSADNMYTAYRNLRPRWQVIYRTAHQMIGAKPVSEVAGTIAGSHYIYATVELPAFEPAYVEHGRRRPKPGPLTEVVDRFVQEKIRAIAQQINSQRQERLDERALDEVHDENKRLDEFKNRFLPSHGDGGGGDGTGDGPGGSRPRRSGTPVSWGEVVEALDYSALEDGIHVARGLQVALRPVLNPSARDTTGRPVRAIFDWSTTDRHIATISNDGILETKGKGKCELVIHVRGTNISTPPIPITVWSVDHVLLTPRQLDVSLGKSQQITAEVTDEDGSRSSNVLLDWKHDAEDQLTVRINREGIVVGNRLGRTAVTAGAGEVWARIPVEVTVIPNPNDAVGGSGFPRLLLTGRDIDPATGVVRDGDPDQPPLWQESSDFVHNVWWLNLQSPDAAFAFQQRTAAPSLWRAYHAGRVIDMVVQVWMTEEFTRKGESQKPEYWAAHLNAMDRHRVRMTQQMWRRLEPYVATAVVPPDEASTSG